MDGRVLGGVDVTVLFVDNESMVQCTAVWIERQYCTLSGYEG
jgi:hypothetical protein